MTEQLADALAHAVGRVLPRNLHLEPLGCVLEQRGRIVCDQAAVICDVRRQRVTYVGHGAPFVTDKIDRMLQQGSDQRMRSLGRRPRIRDSRMHVLERTLHRGIGYGKFDDLVLLERKLKHGREGRSLSWFKWRRRPCSMRSPQALSPDSRTAAS